MCGVQVWLTLRRTTGVSSDAAVEGLARRWSSGLAWPAAPETRETASMVAEEETAGVTIKRPPVVRVLKGDCSRWQWPCEPWVNPLVARNDQRKPRKTQRDRDQKPSDFPVVCEGRRSSGKRSALTAGARPEITASNWKLIGNRTSDVVSGQPTALAARELFFSTELHRRKAILLCVSQSLVPEV